MRMNRMMQMAAALAIFCLATAGCSKEESAPQVQKDIETKEIENLDPAVLINKVEAKIQMGRTDKLNAIRKLGMMGPRASSALPALEKCLDDPKQDIRDAAQEAIKKIKG